MSDLPVKTRPARSGPPHVARKVNAHIAALAAKCGAMDPALITAWPEIMPGDLSAHCRPERLIRQQRLLTLVVSVPNGAAAMRVQYAQSQILQRAAHFLRQPTLKKLQIVQRGTSGTAKVPHTWASQPMTGAAAPAASGPGPAYRPAKSLDDALQQLRQLIDARTKP